MPYPDWRVGQRVTAALLAAMQPVKATKSVDTARTSTTALAADPHLVLALAANAVYELSGFIEYDGNFGGSGDLKMDWTLPSGATMRWAPRGNAAGDTTQKLNSGSVANTLAVAVGTYGVGTTRNSLSPRGYIITSATAGNATLRWAQNSSNAIATTLYANSWVSASRTS